MQITLNEIECLAIRNALTEYYHNISKVVLEKDICSPLAIKVHTAVKQLKMDFTDRCYHE